MNSPVEVASSLVIGDVESVSPTRITALLDIDAPQAITLNTGLPRGFPKINSYILMPNEGGAVVGMIVWIGIEHSMYPKRTGMKDFGLIDLPFPTRKMHIVPVGMLKAKYNKTREIVYSLERGITSFPSIGDKVTLPTTKQYESIIGEEKNEKHFTIGHAPMADNTEVRVDPDKVFGRHLAILGNTGSGKSCSLAGMIKWSLGNAKKNVKNENENLNARFIVLDPNGEYKNTFSDYGARVFQVEPESGHLPLKVPAWMWDSQEWSVFTSATQQAQQPLLVNTLKELRTGVTTEEVDNDAEMLFRVMKARARQIKLKVESGPEAYSGTFGARMDCGRLIDIIIEEVQTFLNDFNFPEKSDVSRHLNDLLNKTINLKEERSFSYKGKTGYNDFSVHDLSCVLGSFECVLKALRKVVNEDEILTDKGANTPIPFNIKDLPDHLELVAQEAGNEKYVQSLIMRIRTMLTDIRMKPIISNQEEDSLLNWLNNYIGTNHAENGNLTVIDLSLVPNEITHIITSVISRVVFESIQRYRKLNDGKTLPTVIAIEEAHNFIKKHNEEGSPSYACAQTFERIAREGRKYGLGLIVSSQRPYELSPTVLSQCNTFLLHRIVNDRDQDLVNRLVPDNLDGLLNELPNLPSRQAILVGWATPIPVIVNMRELDEEHRPQSDDPAFYDVWVGNQKREIDWEEVIKDWE